MLAKESVQLRLASGLSFTEFSYMTLQAADFLHLYREHGVEMQMGGADQWGNITAGLELIRRAEEAEEGDEAHAFALCSPLLTTPDGQKMGKTQSGAVFLDPTLTRPFDFYQYLVNQPDEIVGRLLRWLTLFDAETIADLEARQIAQPEQRPGQRAFAHDLTARVHGRDEADRQARVAEAAFGGGLIEDPVVLADLYQELGGFTIRLPSDGSAITAAGTALASGLFASNSEIRRAISQGGLTINGRRVGAPDETVTPVAERWYLVRSGKRRLAVGRMEG
jgi:tyrosyl-tRNA synthetase